MKKYKELEIILELFQANRYHHNADRYVLGWFITITSLIFVQNPLQVLGIICLMSLVLILLNRNNRLYLEHNSKINALVKELQNKKRRKL